MSLTGFQRRRRKIDEKETKEVEEVDIEEVIKEYHVGGGWYELPDQDIKLRKDEAIEVLEGDG